MPKRPKQECRHFGCGNYQEKDGYCLGHWQPRWKIQATKSDTRYHGRRWQKIRVWVLRLQPVCEKCKSYFSTVVHHVDPIDEGGDFWDHDNLMALCRECHEREHGRKV